MLSKQGEHVRRQRMMMHIDPERFWRFHTVFLFCCCSTRVDCFKETCSRCSKREPVFQLTERSLDLFQWKGESQTHALDEDADRQCRRLRIKIQVPIPLTHPGLQEMDEKPLLTSDFLLQE